MIDTLNVIFLGILSFIGGALLVGFILFWLQKRRTDQLETELHQLKEELLTTQKELEFCERTMGTEVDRKLHQRLENVRREIEEDCKRELQLVYKQRFEEGYKQGKLTADSEAHKHIVYRIIPEEHLSESIFPFGRDTYRIRFYYQLFWKGSFPLTDKIPLVEYEYKVLKDQEQAEQLMELYETSLRKAITTIKELVPEIAASIKSFKNLKGKPIDLRLKGLS